MGNQKLTFGLPFQETLIRFTLHDNDGYKVLDYIKNDSFSLIQHSVIYYTIEKAFKKLGRIPSQPVLSELLEGTFKEREFQQGLSEDDKTEIKELLDTLFQAPAKDGDILLEEAAKFGSFSALKDTLEEVDLTDYDSYDNFASRVQKSIEIKNIREESRGIFLIKDIKDRQMRRQIRDSVIPTPWGQINRLTSAGGYGYGNIIVIMDRPKNLKTFALVNFARGYMRQKKKVLFFDLENGEEDLAMRLEQSLGRINKKDLLKGVKDKDIQKVLRRYKRLGGEIYIRRLPAYSTTAHMQVVIDELYREHGLQFDDLIIDYIALMNSVGKRKDLEETTRIGDAYVDIANLALKNKFEHVVTAMHVVRGAYARSESCYIENDIAKAVDIIRHAHAIYGLNRTPEEREAGIMRMEVVAQRDGIPSGRAYFYADPEIQRMDELTKAQVAEVERLMGTDEPEERAPRQRPKGDV